MSSGKSFGRKVLSSQEVNLFPWEGQGLDVRSRLAVDQGDVGLLATYAQP